MTESALDGAGPCIDCGRRHDEPHAPTCRVAYSEREVLAAAYRAGWEAAMRQQNVPEERWVEPAPFAEGEPWIGKGPSER